MFYEVIQPIPGDNIEDFKKAGQMRHGGIMTVTVFTACKDTTPMTHPQAWVWEISTEFSIA
jgi:hypothetical protein